MAKSAPFEHLKNLILVLTTSQKKDFSRSIHVGSKKTQYETLYEVINQELIKNPDFSYDDFLRLPPKKQGVTQKDFNYVANYLSEKIIESARKTSPTGKLRRELNESFENIYFLYGAELFTACKTELEKARKLATEIDSPIFLIEVHFWERKLLHATAEGFTIEKAQALKESEERLLHSVSENAFLFDVIACTGIEKQQKEPSPELIEKLAVFEQKFLGSGFLDHYSTINAHKLISQVLPNPVFHPKGASHFAGYELNNDGALENQETLIALTVKQSKNQGEDPTRYWAAIANYFSSCFRLGRFDLIEDIEAKLPNDPESIAFLRFRVYYNLLKLMTQYRFSEAVGFVKKHNLLKRLVFQKNRMPHSRFCVNLYLSATVLFVEGEFDMADDFLSQLRKHRTDASPKDTLALASMVHLIIFFEQKMFMAGDDFLDSEMRKTRRFLTDVDEMDAFNRKFLLEFEKMVVGRAPTSVADDARNLLQKLGPLLDHKKDPQPYRVLLAWLHAKGFRQPLNEVIQDFI